MLKAFADKRTQALFVTGRARRFPPDVATRAPRGNRLHALKDDRKGQHAIAVNEQWRICFRFGDGDAHDVEVCDYH